MLNTNKLLSISTSILLLVLVSSCEDNNTSITTDKFTYDDDISDIVHLNDHFFTTNYDLSNNAGDQIDLLVLNFDDNESVLQNRFSLGLNGQGYFALASDGVDLFMQSRQTHTIFKVSTVGEIGYLKTDSVSTDWLPSGITHNSLNDSLIILYRDSHNSSNYRLRELSKSIDESSNSDRTFTLNGVDSTNGALSISFKNPNLYILAWDGTEDVLLTLDYENLTVSSIESLNDSIFVGIDATNDAIYLSKIDRSIVKLRDF
jgi:hypothetical protein